MSGAPGTGAGELAAAPALPASALSAWGWSWPGGGGGGGGRWAWAREVAGGPRPPAEDAGAPGEFSRSWSASRSHVCEVGLAGGVFPELRKILIF